MSVEWQVGQQVSLGRARIAVVERVTSSGRAIVAGRTFNPDGRLRGGSYSSERIERITPEILNEIRVRDVGIGVNNAVVRAEKWVRNVFWFSRRGVTAADMATAERLIEAIREAIENPCQPDAEPAEVSDPAAPAS